MNDSILVTGGAGFIGSHVARHLLQRGHRVLVLDDLSGGFKENVPPEAEFVEGDAGDPLLLDRLFSQHRFRYVFHLAAYAAEGLSHFIRAFNYRNNLLTSVELINASVRYDVQLFVFTSSIAVYGKGQVPMDESMVPQPEDPYGIAKYAVELDLHAAAQQFGLKSVIFRPHNVYGINQNLGDPYRNVIGIFMNQIMQGHSVPIFGDGWQTRAFSSINDVAPVIASAIDVPDCVGRVFNVGSDTPVTVNSLAAGVMAAMGKIVSINYLPARREVHEAFADHELVKRIFQLDRPAIGLETGLGEMAAWAWKTGPRQGKPFGPIEIAKGLPSSWAALCHPKKSPSGQ